MAANSTFAVITTESGLCLKLLAEILYDGIQSSGDPVLAGLNEK